jgi:hypothetical protein
MTSAVALVPGGGSGMGRPAPARSPASGTGSFYSIDGGFGAQ